MYMKPDCLACLYNQTLRVVKAINCEEDCAVKVLKESAKLISKLKIEQTPPEAASLLYPKISEIVGKIDLYEEKKIESTDKALKLLELVLKKMNNSEDIVDTALRAAVAGNVIDFATEVTFDIKKEIETIFEAEFAVDHKELFKKRLKEAKSLMVIGDNVGEHLFDKVMIETFLDFNPKLDIYYVVRGRPIINDVTVSDAKAIDMDKIATIVDSGVDTPGFILDRANEETKELFKKAELILAKGMGNFECMEEMKDERLFFLFKVKCSVVADKIGKNVGDLICMSAG
ncbi:damage-control phosphatase ARMT1 family protein [Nitrosophilus labii]|uniref:damage-control phosphatase ARMT1 family protein n=1 Tax=Nitrosophilus labii TaxID=2706014 RepID=UPI001656B88A|nr:ARMT1-like domain-containing protein [Nitrosophilus labii]